MANATETAAKAAKAQAALAKALRQKNNENTAKFFAAGMTGMMVLFMIFHLTRAIFKRTKSERGRSTLSMVLVAVTRYLALSHTLRALSHSLLGLPGVSSSARSQVSHLAVMLLYSWAMSQRAFPLRS